VGRLNGGGFDFKMLCRLVNALLKTVATPWNITKMSVSAKQHHYQRGLHLLMDIPPVLSLLIRVSMTSPSMFSIRKIGRLSGHGLGNIEPIY